MSAQDMNELFASLHPLWDNEGEKCDALLELGASDDAEDVAAWFDCWVAPSKQRRQAIERAKSLLGIVA